MNTNELKQRAEVFQSQALVRTLHQTSERKSDDSDDASQESHALDTRYDSASLKCLDFDALKLSLYPPKAGVMTPCSVDALVFEHTGTYLVEFKFNTAAIENIIRKVYDSVMLLIEHGRYAFC